MLFAIANHLQYVDLYGVNATKANWDAAIKNHPGAFLCGVGHGNATVYTGQNYAVLLDAYSSPDRSLASGCHGSFLSCRFGKSMVSWIKAGLQSFMGYSDDFVFLVVDQNDLNDRVAAMFGNSHFAYDAVFLDEMLRDSDVNVASERAFNASQAAFKKEYDSTESADLRQYLAYDRSIQVHGTKDSQGPTEPWYCRARWLPAWFKYLLGCAA